jgi:hypothetical protein
VCDTLGVSLEGASGWSVTGKAVFCPQRCNIKSMRMSFRVCAATFSLGAALTFAVERRSLSPAEFRGLVRALLADGWTKLPGFAIKDYPEESKRVPYAPNSCVVHATRNNPGGGSTIGHYAIDLETGDVWDWVGCARFASPSLSKAQAALRQEIGLGGEEHRRKSKNAPWCRPGQEPGLYKVGRPAF